MPSPPPRRPPAHRPALAALAALAAGLFGATANARAGDEADGALVCATHPAPRPPTLPTMARLGARVLYLNVSDGTEAVGLGEDDDAVRNLSGIGSVAQYPAFRWPQVSEAGPDREAFVERLAAAVHRAFLPYDVVVATRRPALGPYTMVLVGGHPSALGLEGNVAGVALLDCADWNPANVVFAFPDVLRGSFEALVVTVAQEAAHSWGLEHTTNATDIMFPRLVPTQTTFPDADSAIEGPKQCGRERQNSHRLLLEVLGPWTGGRKAFADGRLVDDEPPTLGWLAPLPSSDAVTAVPLVVRLSAADNVRVARIELRAGPMLLTRTAPPWEWTIPGLPRGPIDLTATAFDDAGNRTGLTVEALLASSDDGGCAVAPGGPRRRGAAWGFVLFAALVACSRRRLRL